VSYNLTKGDFRRLLQWQRRMVTLFVYTWIYILLVVARSFRFWAWSSLETTFNSPFVALHAVTGSVVNRAFRCATVAAAAGSRCAARTLPPDQALQLPANNVFQLGSGSLLALTASGSATVCGAAGRWRTANPTSGANRENH
jgi:hypothetical protein